MVVGFSWDGDAAGDVGGFVEGLLDGTVGLCHCDDVVRKGGY